MKASFVTHNPAETIALGQTIGHRLKGGEVLEFISDLGGGKTTFLKGLAKGFGSKESIASPTFTISYVYPRSDGKEFHHFDFYRLDKAGVVAAELQEVIAEPEFVVAIEWGEIVHNVLPRERIIITITSPSEQGRQLTIQYPKKYAYLFN